MKWLRHQLAIDDGDVKWFRYLRCLIRGYHMDTGIADERRCSECHQPMGAEIP